MLRIDYWALSFLLFLTWGGGARGAERAGDDSNALLPADFLLADVAFLHQTLEAVHPDLYARVARPEIAQQRRELETKLSTGLTKREFYRLTASFVKQFDDDHTLVEAPDGVEPIEPAVVHRYRWKFQVLEGNVGYIDFAYMTDRAAWRTFLAKTFQTIRERELSGLIVDLRTNTGGDSSLADELLAYLTDKPYRPTAQKKWRFSTQWISQLPTADPFGLEDGDPAIEPPADYRDLFRQTPPLALRRLFHDRALPRERAILERHAPHWLDTTATASPENEVLTLGFSELHKPPTVALRFTGPTCFLIGPTTFSSGVVLANIVEDFQLAPLIGEETKPCNQFGEPYQFSLPHSGLKVAVATAQFVRANGDATNFRGALPTIPSKTRPESLAASDETLTIAKNWIKTAVATPAGPLPQN